MKKFLIIFSIVFCGLVSAQKTEKIYGNEDPYEQADIFPEYTTGQSGFKTELHQNLDLSKLNLNLDHYAKLEFIIEKDGSMSGIKSSGENQAFNAEVISALKKIKTKWQSAENEGKKVRYHVSTSVSHDREARGMADRPNMFGKKKVDSKKIFEYIHQRPHFHGGIDHFKDIIKSELGKTIENYSFTAQFIIETDGSLSDIIINGEDKEKNESIQKAIQNCKQKWLPAKFDDQNVRSRLMVKFL